jgi:hypothetical protein
VAISINEVEPEEKTQQSEIGRGVGCEEVFYDNGALIADEAGLGVGGTVAGESRFGAWLAVHRDIPRPREGFPAEP